jgi:dynein heavy chain
LFNDALQSVDKEKQPNFDSLVKNLLDNITEQLYFKISIGLFEKHKLIFALLICSSIQRQANIIDPKEWSLFIRGPSVDQFVTEKSLNWLTDLQWKQAC